MMRKTVNKWTALCLSAALVLSLVPAQAARADEATDVPQQTVTDPAEAVKNLTAPALVLDSATKAVLNLKWTDVEDADSYELYLYDMATGTNTLLAATEDTSYKHGGLSMGTTVYFRIRCVAANEDGTVSTGEMSPVYSFTTKTDAPAGLAVTGQGADSVSLRWDAVAGANDYVVYRYNKTYKYYESVGTTTDGATEFTDTGLDPATVYRYKVAARISVEGVKSAAVITCTLPSQVGIISVKSGDERAKICWNKIKGSTGYTVYQVDEAGNYLEIANQEGAASTTCIVENLAMNSTVTFSVSAYKIYGEVTYRGATSAAISQTITGVQPTSQQPLLYKTWKKFKKSATYKKFKQFQKNIVKSKAYVLPGMITTNVSGFNADNMCPQAICFAKSYLLIAAYDLEGIENSVIYIVDKKSKEYITSIVLSNKSHVGGLAFDGENIWISNGSKVSAISYASVHNAVASAEDYVEVPYAATCNVLTKASYMTYYDGKLWVGEYSESASKYVYSYTVSGSGENLKLSQVNRMTVPEKTQGIVFDSTGRMFLSRSCQVGDWLSVYLSVLEVYHPGSADSSGVISIGSASMQRTMPPMSEGLAISGKNLYVNFESAAFTSCNYRIDRIVAYKVKKLK